LHWSHRSATAGAYGLVLGMAMFTYLHHAAMYLLLALVLIAPSAWTAFGVGLLYGAGVGGVVLVARLRQSRPGYFFQWPKRDTASLLRLALVIVGSLTFAIATPLIAVRGG